MERIKRAISLLLAVVMFITACPISASANTTDAETQETGVLHHGDYLYTVLPDGTAAISGYTGTPNSDGTGTHLRIPAEIDGIAVTQLAEEAFAYRDDIHTVLIPESITTIGNAAFHHCSALEAIGFLGSAPAFGITAAEGSHVLKTVFSLEDSDISMFCGLLVHDLSEEEARNIEILEFEDAQQLTEAYETYTIEMDGRLLQVDPTAPSLPDILDISGIANTPLADEVGTSPSQEETTVPATENPSNILASGSCGQDLTWTLDIYGVLTIDGTGSMSHFSSGTAPWAEYADSITTLILPEGITSIGNYAFYGCSKLTGALIIPDSVTSIGSYAFCGCAGFTGELMIPDSVSSISEAAFSGMSGITSLVFGSGLTSFCRLSYAYQNPYYEMNNVVSVTFTGLTVPGLYHNSIHAFNSMTKLETIYVPASAYHNYAQSLKPYIQKTTKIRCHDVTEDFLISDGVLTAYFGTGTEVVIPDGVEEIGAYAFLNCPNLTTLVMPDSITVIPNNAFKDFTALTTVDFSANLTSIGNYAFSGCTALQTLALPDGLTSIGSYAFNGCTALSGNLVLPESLRTIGDSAFQNCSGFTGDLRIPEGVTSILSNTFLSCSGFDGSLILPESLTTIDNSAFHGCSRLSGDLRIPNNVSSIGIYAFRNCSGFTGELVIPNQVSYISRGSFSGCTGITSIQLGTGVTSIYAQYRDYDHPFYQMGSVKTVTFTGATVPALYSGSHHPFIFMNRLETVYVPAESYTAYASAYSSYLPSSARLYSMGISSDFQIEDGVLVAYLGSDTEVAIPDGVTAIASNAFLNCSSLVQLSMPDSVTTISSHAFRGCSSLTTVVFSANLESIGDYALTGCTALQSLSLPASLTSIGSYAFSGCTALQSVAFPDGLTSIGNYAFNNCTGLQSVAFPDGLTYIGSYAFYNCRNLNGSLTFGTGLTYIGSYAFCGCSGFSGELVIPETITAIEPGVFQNCSGFSGELVIPEGITTIGDSAFYGCSGFTGDLNLPQSLTSFGAYAFRNCSGLTGELVIPDQVSYISRSSFSGCTGITSIRLGTGVTSIYAQYRDYDHPFYQMGSVKTVTFTGTTVPALYYGSHHPFIFMNRLEAVYVPAEAYTAYSSAYSSYLPASARLRSIGASNDFQIEDGVLVAYLGSEAEVVIPDGVTTIASNAFLNCSSLVQLRIPDSITTISSHAFRGCSSLTTVVFSANLESIGDYAFSGCTALQPLSLPASLTSIGSYAFNGCTGLQSVDFPDGLTSIGSYAFNRCTALQSLALPDSLTTIAAYAFYECTGLTGGLVIPDSVTTIGNYAFANCRNLNGSLTFGSGLTYIGSYAFCGCSGFSGELVIPETITAIAPGIFQNCSGFSGELVIPEGITTIGDSAFYGCSGFTGDLNLPQSLTSFGAYAFRNCSGLTGELVIPDQVSYISQSSFSGCTGITSIRLGTGVTSIYAQYRDYDHPFYQMGSVKTVTFTGTTVPALYYGSHHPFIFMNRLEAVYVPAEAYTAYSSAYSSYLPASARLCSIGASNDFQIEDGVLVAYWGSEAEVVIPDGVTAIASNAFLNCSSLVRLRIPDSVTTISSYAFRGCSGLNAIDLPTGLEAIDPYTFYNCTALAQITFPDSLTTIGANAFYNCTSLNQITFPDSLTSIGANAFYNCTALTGGLIIPDSVTTIGESAFQNCTGLNGTIVLSSGLTAISNRVFYNCSNIIGVRFGENLTSIGVEAFYNCTALTGDLILPDSIQSIGASAFLNCRGFNGKLHLPDQLHTLGTYAFRNCSNFTGELILPDHLSYIPQGGFSSCSGFTFVSFGAGITSVYAQYADYDHPFYQMYNVTEVVFNRTAVPTLSHGSRHPLQPMSKLKTIYVPEEAYDAYVAFCSGSVPSSAVISTDFLSARITNLTVSKLYSQTVSLTWDAHTSERVVGYVVERDGEQVGTTSNCTFTERDLTTGTTYTYRIYGYTEDGSTTGDAEISVTPTAPQISSIRTGNSLNKIGLKNTIYIYVANNGNLDPLGSSTPTAMLYYLSGGKQIPIGEAIRSTTMGSSAVAVYSVQWDVTDIADGPYTLLFRFTDVDGVSTEYRQAVSVDRSVPDQIVGVTAIGDITVIRLTWAISSEADTNIYRIYRRAEGDTAFRLVAQINNRQTLSYTDSNVKTDRIYYYYVVGVNEFGQEGEISDITGATLSYDTEKPVVTKLSPVNASYVARSIRVSLTSQDNVSVTQSELYYSTDGGVTWTQLASARNSGVSATLDTTTLTDGELRIKGIAYDAAGNVSEPLTYVYQIDNTGPQQVQGLGYESTDVTITLHWDDVADDDIRFYRVEQRLSDGTYATVTDVYSTLGANIYNLTPNSSYIYRVVGYDIQSNRGTPSEEIIATTQADTTAPVITRIRPTSGYYSDSISLSISAEDEFCVASITLQTSADGVNWDDAYIMTYTDTRSSRTLSHTLSLDGWEEGYLFVRAIAADAAGNISDTSATAPYVQHMVDKTAPAAPQNVTATGNIGYIEVAWVQGQETDLNRYSIYRAESADGAYQLLANGLATINYIDRNVEEDIVYYYKVAVNDVAGNQSDFSAAVSALVAKDTEAPVVLSVYPESGSLIGAEFKTVSVLATDNHALSSISIEYSSDGSAYFQLARQNGINAYSKTLTATIPLTGFSHDSKVYIRVSATDKSGNTSQQFITEYTVDAMAPTASNVAAVYEDDSVLISWTSNQESDLIGYRIYRKTGISGSYNLVAQRSAAEGQTAYNCFDYNLPLEKATYYYKVEAVDACGNTSSVVTAAVEVPDRSLPTPVISCESTFEVGVEYFIDATASKDNSAIVSYLFDFGDGSTSTDRRPIHIYTKTGEYTITLTVTDDDGNQSTCTKLITVKERSMIGQATIRVVDENGVAVSGASVYFDLGEETQLVKATNSSGYVTFTADVGKHTVGCIIPDNQWLPAKKDIIITAGEETSVTMTLVHHVMIEGVFEIKRMTFEEIIAAGIDVSNPENQYMVQVNVKLVYGAETVETSFTYNETTGQTIAKPTIINTSSGETRQIIPVVIGGGGKGSWGDGGDYTFSEEATIAYLDIPVGVSAMKEFFNVNLHIINNAGSEFSMLDNVIQLNVPEGLTIMDTYVSENSPTVHIAEIKGQTTETITWILRGDALGEYYLSADYSGILGAFNEPIHTQFVATEPIQVYGLSNMKLEIQIPDELDHGTLYYNVSLTNEGKIDVYRPKLDTGHVLIETELFDATGANVTDIIALDAQKVGEFGLATSITGALDVLPGGYRLTKHYMCVSQTSYTELEMTLRDYAYTVQNTYGLEVVFTVHPVSYFKSNLSANINASEKADLTFTTNQSAYDYLMANENYIYWSMYASTGEVATSLTTNAQESMWELLKLAAGDGDFKALFGADDEELIQAIILDAMELSVSSEDFSKYYAICDWTTLVKDWTKNEGYGEWLGVVTEWANEDLSDLSKDALADVIDSYGKSLPHTFELIATEYKWEAYKAIYQGEYMDFDNFVIAKWEVVIEEYYVEATDYYSETRGSKLLHKLLSKESFTAIWEAIGFGLKAAKGIVSATEKTTTDISMYFAAQSTLDSCNLFLDTLSDFMCDQSGDARKVAKAAKKIKEKLNELDPVGSLAEHLLDEAFWLSVDFAKDKALDKLNLTPNAYVIALKVALRLTVFVGNCVFNVDERHDIADNIRFVSCMTIALRYGIKDARTSYAANKTDDAAKRYMQLISYLLNIRAIGESQVALFGISYEVLPGVFDSSELFYAVRDMSGATDATSWIEWRDFVEDKISMLRVQLLKNPLATNVSGMTAPIVTFDYAAGQTAQTFSSDYEYSLNRGATWTPCDGSAIAVAPQAYSIELQVRRVDHSGTNEKMVASVTIYGAPSLADSGIRVLKTADGYRVENLNNHRNYQVTFSQTPLSFQYGDALDLAIPAGSYSYTYTTDTACSYVYIRSVADTSQYASYVYAAPIYPMRTITLTQEGSGTVTGAGCYEYGAEVTLTATAGTNYVFDGWFMDGQLLSTDTVLTIQTLTDYNLTAKFSKTTPTEGWYLDNDCWYYYLNGEAVTGWLRLREATYYMDANGVMQTGWLQLGSNWYYLTGGGAMVIGWCNVNGSWYYFDGCGIMATGWLQLGGTWYYFQSGGAMVTGWNKINGSWYFFDGNGSMQTGWKELDGSWYYFLSSGAMATGWIQVGGQWYYLLPSGIMATGWIQISGKWYYLRSGGSMTTGWVSVDNSWYYMNQDGTMRTGWLQIGSDWYYLQSNGVMVTGTLQIDGVWYNFDASGVWIP